MQIKIFKYAPSNFGEVWPIVTPWLEKTLEVAPPYWALSDLERMCANGNYILWLVAIDNKPVGILLTEIIKFDTCLIVSVPWMGGSKMRAWIGRAQEVIEQWGKAAGAKYLAGGGREGWGRVASMKNYGSLLAKEL
jgi:hypothetical protein